MRECFHLITVRLTNINKYSIYDSAFGTSSMIIEVYQPKMMQHSNTVSLW